MLTYVRSSLMGSDAQTVVNPVNTVGVMGKGIAKEFGRRYPAMYSQYKALCAKKALDVGKLWLWKGSDRWVLNFPTKTDWRRPSSLAYIQAGLEKFCATFEERQIAEIAFPRLGCGNGGLEWSDVRPLMERYLAPLPIPVYIHDFAVELGAPEHDSEAALPAHFDLFWEDIRASAKARDHQFKEIGSARRFAVQVRDDALSIISGDSANADVPREDIEQLWTVLLNSALTPEKMSGNAYEQQNGLVSILSTLPYIKTFQIVESKRPPVVGLFGTKPRKVLDAEVTRDGIDRS